MGRREREKERARERERERERDNQRYTNWAQFSIKYAHSHTDCSVLCHYVVFLAKFEGVSLNYLSGSWVGFGIHYMFAPNTAGSPLTSVPTYPTTVCNLTSH